MSEELAHTNIYTEKDYYRMPEDVRAEFINGQFYYMSAPSRIQQEILSFIFKKLHIISTSRKGTAKSTRLPSPSSFLKTMIKPW